MNSEIIGLITKVEPCDISILTLPQFIPTAQTGTEFSQMGPSMIRKQLIRIFMREILLRTETISHPSQPHSDLVFNRTIKSTNQMNLNR